MRKLLLPLLITSCFSVSAQQTDTVKLMSYNLMYYRATGAPCTHSVSPNVRDQHLETIVNYSDPDIFIVNELGASPSTSTFLKDNVLNTGGQNKYEAAAFTNNTFSDIVNMLYYDKNKFVLYDQKIVERDKNNFPIVRVIDFYRLYYNDPALANGADTVFFTVVACHLKAGSGNSNEVARENAAHAIMDYIENNVIDQNIILCGDLNVYESSEPGYQIFTNYSNPAFQLSDPLNAPGNWNNNSSFALYHTQSTHASSSGCFSGGGMDDRFDQFLVSDAVLSGSDKIEYYRYRILGQDAGNGCCNSNFNYTNNIQVPANVAQSLYDFSDHLPITLEIEIQKSNIGLNEQQKAEQNLRFNNPMGNRLTLKFDSEDNRTFTINVAAIDGKILLTNRWNTQSALDIDCRSWPEGIYILNITDNKGVHITKKLIK